MNDSPTTQPSAPEPVAYIKFLGGPMRAVYEDDRSQFVIDDDGNRVNGVWYIPKSEFDTPTIVTR